VGADTALNIRNWYEGEWILENFKLITVARPGYEDPAIVDIPMTLNISSTEIRELVKNKKQIYPLVPRIVSQCIKRFGLYE
jgi:nicotinic acid mononucleotide adenylyltransferase